MPFHPMRAALLIAMFVSLGTCVWHVSNHHHWDEDHHHDHDGDHDDHHH
jgi:hypothetical protein